MWLSSSEPPRLRADRVRCPSVQIPSLMFAKKILLPVVLFQLLVSVELSVMVHASHLVLVRVGVFPASLGKWCVSPSHIGCSCHILVLFFFCKLCISSKSLPCLSFREAAWYGGCHVMSFQANDRLIYSSVVVWLFSFPSQSLIERIVFSLCVFYLKFIFFLKPLEW